MSFVAYIVAVVLFLFAGLGADWHAVTQMELVALGLAAFALAHVLP